MAAHQKAVESTVATVERDQESLEQAQEVLKEHLTATVQEEALAKALKESHSARAVHLVTDQEEALVKAQTVQEETSEKILKEDHSVKAVHSAATDHVVHSAKVQTDRADHSARVLTVQEEASVKARREGVSHLTEEVSQTESQVDSETQARRALQSVISTTSAMRVKAESTR